MMPFGDIMLQNLASLNVFLCGDLLLASSQQNTTALIQLIMDESDITEILQHKNWAYFWTKLEATLKVITVGKKLIKAAKIVHGN